MAITSILRDWADGVSILRIISTDSLSTIGTTGYLTAQAANIAALNSGAFEYAKTDFALVYASNGWGFFQISSDFASLIPFAFSASVVGTPVVVGDFAVFQSTSGNLEDLGYLPSNAAKTNVVMANGTVAAGNIAIFTDTAGTVGENVASLNNVANSSATPGTVRSIIGQMTSTATTQTSGNLVGVRGVVNYVGASGGFLYGAQGKLIPTGTISGSSWNAGLFGQLDISAATVNAGQMAPIWGDYGATSGTLTNQTGLYGIAMTNTTAAVLQGQLYLYGGAQNLLLLNTNAGLSGVTYFKNAGTGSGSWGNATPPTPSKVLKINVDGTDYYLPLVAQNT
jgi:hypothetical protein